MGEAMSTTIKINVSRMFAGVEPCCVSGSQAELGPAAGQITWRNAQEIGTRGIGVSKGDECLDWLLSPSADAAEGMREWAGATGRVGRDELDLWADEECLALLAQNIASELRMLGSDECEEARVHECR